MRAIGFSALSRGRGRVSRRSLSWKVVMQKRETRMSGTPFLYGIGQGG